ncbi:DNA repair protein RecO [Mycoplasmopsis cynos]|uniref:DNA repair protein RecO n=1 Tax=Mycoplasmopsis cynos TaxID=171284 RepID=UPI002AFDCED0|nr:DNA repair protein RecO [Mycoplasmopsis cynos]WQQ15099.1 DNA repair protein RecO [Mycoplasmopsis cynos]
MSVNIEKAIVIDINLKSDNNHIVTFFNQKGIFRLVASGIDNLLSKNRNNLQLGSIVEIAYFPTRLKGKIGRLRSAYLETLLNLLEISNLTFFKNISNLLKNINSSNHLFELYQRVFPFIGKKYNSKLMTFFYAQSLFYFGIDPNYNQCRVCHRKNNLINFNIDKGGFICNRHSKDEPIQSIEYLNAIWLSFNNFKKYIFTIGYNLNYKIKNLYINIIKEAGYYI